MGMGGLITDVNMPFEAIERQIHDAYLRLAISAALARDRQRHYLDGQTSWTLFGTVTALTAAHPWALDGFGTPAWTAYQPDPQAPPPDGLRVGVLRTGDGLPPTPAVVEAQRLERQDADQDLIERLHPLLQRRGLVLRLSLPGLEMLLLATLSCSLSRCRRSRDSRSSSRRCAARRCSSAARLPLRAIAPLVCIDQRY